MAGDEFEGLPGVTRDIFVEFIERLIDHYVSDSRESIAKAMKGKTRYFMFKVTDFDLYFQTEGTIDGDSILHWEPVAKTTMEYAADSKTWDDVLTGRVPPAEAYLRRRVKVRGSIADAIRYLALIPHIQRAYIKARQETAEKYGLMELAEQYPIPEKMLESL